MYCFYCCCWSCCCCCCCCCSCCCFNPYPSTFVVPCVYYITTDNTIVIVKNIIELLIAQQGMITKHNVLNARDAHFKGFDSPLMDDANFSDLFLYLFIYEFMKILRSSIIYLQLNYFKVFCLTTTFLWKSYAIECFLFFFFITSHIIA